MKLPKRIRYKGQIYEAVNLAEENEQDNYEYTEEEIAYFEKLADDANRHPEEWVSLEDLKRECGLI